MMKNINLVYPVLFRNVKIRGGFLGKRQEINRNTTMKLEFDQLMKTGRIEAFKLEYREDNHMERRSFILSDKRKWMINTGNEKEVPGYIDALESPVLKKNIPRPHYFWDSDVAKWVEAAAYCLADEFDEQLKQNLDHVIGLIEGAQQEDGYLNIYFTVCEPDQRWMNLRDKHELYCAGHLIEAAVACFLGIGDTKLLDVIIRYADYIDSVFGPEPNKKKGFPGHEEIELALVKLYGVTGTERYLKLARFFVDERGKKPHYFDMEAKLRGEDAGLFTYEQYQAHLPVREQETAQGHSVRAMYLYCAMTDISGIYDDGELRQAVMKLWENVVKKRMYITGAVGSSAEGERFTYDYDLDNEKAYAETCASIGLMFWAHRMLLNDPDSKYADVMERALYNGILGGVSLDGSKFFYANPLAVYPEEYLKGTIKKGDHISCQRLDWFGCACCPPNIARLIASLGSYIYTRRENELHFQIYAESKCEIGIGGKNLVISQKTSYPLEGEVLVTFSDTFPVPFTLAFRIPGYCEMYSVSINGRKCKSGPEDGYMKIKRKWKQTDVVKISFDMECKIVKAHPEVRANGGKAALMRGPLVYCLEEADNGRNLSSIMLTNESPLRAIYEKDMLGGIFVIEASGKKISDDDMESSLYINRDKIRNTNCKIRAIPFYARMNREPGEMIVWINDLTFCGKDT